MTIYYLDASAWVKRYLTEAGSARIRDLFVRKQPFACCTLGYAEVLSAIARQQGVRQISPDRRNTLRRDIQTDWDEMLHVTIDADVIRLAADLAWNLKLRGADSVHLAAASRLNEVLIARSASLVLVTADSEMVSAAGSHRLNVLNPAKAEVS